MEMDLEGYPGHSYHVLSMFGIFMSLPGETKDMSRTFSFRQSRELLRVDPKTFLKWLQKAGIDPARQVNLADTRERYLTEEQLAMLAKQHGRTLPTLDREPDPPQPVTFAMLVERLDLLEQKIDLHFEQQETQGLVALQIINKLQQHLANLERIVPQQHERQQAKQSGGSLSSTVLEANIGQASSSSRAPIKKKAGKETKGKKLAHPLIPLHVFAHEHGVSQDAADHAAQTGKVTVKRGRWLYNSRYITSALDQQGQREFYALFHERKGFKACGKCPHVL